MPRASDEWDSLVDEIRTQEVIVEPGFVDKVLYDSVHRFYRTIHPERRNRYHESAAVRQKAARRYWRTLQTLGVLIDGSNLDPAQLEANYQANRRITRTHGNFPVDRKLSLRQFGHWKEIDAVRSNAQRLLGNQDRWRECDEAQEFWRQRSKPTYPIGTPGINASHTRLLGVGVQLPDSAYAAETPELDAWFHREWNKVA